MPQILLLLLILLAYEACMHLQKTCNAVDEALQFYAMRRTYDGKGITNPSQTRWTSWHPPFHTLPRVSAVKCIETRS